VLGADLFGHNFYKWKISTSFHSCITENLITDKKIHFVIRINLILANKGNSGVQLVARNASAVDNTTWKCFIILVLVLRHFTRKCPLEEIL
jgi:hypothetical protein